MERWQGKVAIVTGASLGIGAAITKKLVEAGLKVVGLARNKERLDELAKSLQQSNGEFYALQADVTKEEDIIKAFEWINTNLGPIHILINNAGVVRTTTLMEAKTKLLKDIFDTNILGLCIATREAVKNMRANNVDGHIIHINSVSGHYVPHIPDLNAYPASKHAVTALTETLRQELNSIGSKIKISSLSPGYVATEIFVTAAIESGLPPSKRTDAAKIASLQPEDVADAVLYLLGTPPHVQIHELTIRPIGELF